MFGSKYTFQQISSGIIIPGLVLIAALAAYFIILPGIRAVSEQRNILKTQEQELADRSGSLDNVRRLLGELDEKRPSLMAVDKVIPKSPEIPELLANLDSVSLVSGLSIDSIQLSQALSLTTARGGEEVGQFKRQENILASTRNIGLMEVNLKAVGSYDRMKNFLLNLELNQRLMDVQELVFEEVDEESGLQEYTLKILTYYQL